MARQLLNAPIDSKDLIEFLDTSSDFAFELRCAEKLVRLGFRTEHGGSYTDRVTGKPRQFDIRAQKENPPLCVCCAVECKNLAESYPLLTMCVPRAPNESFHELLLAYRPSKGKPGSLHDLGPAFRPNCKTIRVDHPQSEYVLGAPVGKASAQVGRAKDNTITSNDSDVFEKWSQALASAHDLADEAAEKGERYNGTFLSLILPILVVPDGTLWKVDYDKNGVRTTPNKVDRCSFFVGRDYSAGNRMRSIKLTISHLEFVTLTGLETLAGNMLAQDSTWFSFAFEETQRNPKLRHGKA